MTSHEMASELFSPFLHDGKVDARLLRALLIPAGDFEGQFDKVPDADENTCFDFYMETKSGRRYFFDVKLAESAFDSCADDARHREKFERHYLPHLRERVDARWLEPGTFFANSELLGNLSYLGRYPQSGVVFIFPRANESLMNAEETIKKIVSKTLAPRVAILYLDYLVERIMVVVADDETLREHFRQFHAKYIGPYTLHSASKEP